MTATEALLQQPVAQAIAWALVQFLWQGALIAVLTAVALTMLKRSAADVRYVVGAIALSLMLTMPVVTAVQYWHAASSGTSAAWAPPLDSVTNERAPGANGVASSARTDATPRLRPEDRLVSRAAIVDGASFNRRTIEPWLPMLLMIWLCGVTLLTLRLMSGWLWIQRLRTHGEAADDAWQHMARRLCRRLHITRHVCLLDSSLVDVPTVIGWMKPVILLPGSVLAGLSPQQLEAILAHELAHIRRHDYVVNLVQTVVETLLFYHPAVWWLSRRIRIERENCCDDLAVSLCGDPYTYARALTNLEERRGPRGGLVLAASGGSLLQRVRRLLGAPASHAGRGPGWLAGTAAVLLLAGIVAGALGNDVMRAQHAATAQVVAVPVRPAALPVATTEPRIVAPVAVPRTAMTATTVEPQPVAATTATPAVASTLPVTDVRPAPAPATIVDSGVAMRAPAIAAPAVAPVTADHADSAEQRRKASAVVARVQETSGNFSWSNNGEKLQVSYRGDVEFSDDDKDVKRLSPGGYLKIKDGGWFRGRTIEFRADASGKLARRYWVGMSERPFEPEGRQWLAQALPRFIRQTGMAADSRVARILKASGPSGVLAEIGHIEGSWAKRVYFKELLRQATLDPQTTRQVVAQAGREIDSDFELASLLIDGADKLLVDEASRKAYFDAARSIESDFEMRRVFSAALKRTALPPAALAAILDTSRSIDSDFELAELLSQLVRSHPLDQTTSRPFFAAAATIESDFEQRRVLSTLASRRDLSAETVGAMFDSAIGLESDFELAELLTQVVKQHEVEGALRVPFFRAVDSIESGFERGRVLQTLARRGGASEGTLMAILKSVRGVGSHEASEVLLTIAATHPLSGPARDLYIDAAEKLGDYEQGRVLTALVKNERRR
jgi:beta-lactamase regulating signal transducer with metallopeptidase domain